MKEDFFQKYKQKTFNSSMPALAGIVISLQTSASVGAGFVQDEFAGKLLAGALIGHNTQGRRLKANDLAVFAARGPAAQFVVKAHELIELPRFGKGSIAAGKGFA
jgi:hypothetical protein